MCLKKTYCALYHVAASLRKLENEEEPEDFDEEVGQQPQSSLFSLDKKTGCHGWVRLTAKVMAAEPCCVVIGFTAFLAKYLLQEKAC